MVNEIHPTIQSAASLYLDEALACATATPALGFAAMTTALSVVVGVGEALIGKSQPGDAKCISAFCSHLSASDWLIIAPNTPMPPAHDLLTEVRNALIHALALPNHVALIPDAKHAPAAVEQGKSLLIVVERFVAEVGNAMAKISASGAPLTGDHFALTKDRSHFQVIGGVSATGTLGNPASKPSL